MAPTSVRRHQDDAPRPSRGIIRVLIVDDHALVSEGTRLLLEREPDLEVVGVASNGLEALDLVARAHPNVVLMDIEMPQMDGIEATARIAADFPGVAVLVVSAYDDDEYVERLLRSGASGYFLKDVRGEQLIEAIRSVSQGNFTVHPAIVRKVVRALTQPSGDVGQDGLSERELVVLPWSRRG